MTTYKYTCGVATQYGGRCFNNDYLSAASRRNIVPDRSILTNDAMRSRDVNRGRFAPRTWRLSREQPRANSSRSAWFRLLTWRQTPNGRPKGSNPRRQDIGPRVICSSYPDESEQRRNNVPRSDSVSIPTHSWTRGLPPPWHRRLIAQRREHKLQPRSIYRSRDERDGGASAKKAGAAARSARDEPDRASTKAGGLLFICYICMYLTTCARARGKENTEGVARRYADYMHHAHASSRVPRPTRAHFTTIRPIESIRVRSFPIRVCV